MILVHEQKELIECTISEEAHCAQCSGAVLHASRKGTCQRGIFCQIKVVLHTSVPRRSFDSGIGAVLSLQGKKYLRQVIFQRGGRTFICRYLQDGTLRGI
jgi:hypothetical protein